MAIAGGVLLIVCANVANLLIARGAARRREMALRLAVGGSRWQIARLLLVESLVLAAAGTAAGLLIASWGADALLGFYEAPDAALAFTPGRTCASCSSPAPPPSTTALVAGLAPAMRSTRVDLVTTLKGSGGGVVNEQARMRKSLVVVQVALSFLLLICAGLFVRSLDNLLAVDPGFRTARTVSFSISSSRRAATTPSAPAHSRGRSSSGVGDRRACSSSAYAFQSLLGGGAWGMGFTVEGFTPKPGEGAGVAGQRRQPRLLQGDGDDAPRRPRVHRP